MNRNTYIVFILCALFLGAGIPKKVATPGGPGMGPAPVDYTGPYPYNPVIKNLTYSLDGNKVKLNWDLSLPGEWIGVFRGKTPIALLPGYYKEFEYEEEELGYFRITVGINYLGSWVHSQDILINVGKLAWEHPDQVISGYYLYLGEATGSPQQVLPYHDPYDQSKAHDVFTFNQLWLSTLYEHGLIESGKTYYAASASYMNGCPDQVISNLTPPVTFTFHVNLDSP